MRSIDSIGGRGVQKSLDRTARHAPSGGDHGDLCGFRATTAGRAASRPAGPSAHAGAHRRRSPLNETWQAPNRKEQPSVSGCNAQGRTGPSGGCVGLAASSVALCGRPRGKNVSVHVNCTVYRKCVTLKYQRGSDVVRQDCEAHSFLRAAHRSERIMLLSYLADGQNAMGSGALLIARNGIGPDGQRRRVRGGRCSPRTLSPLSRRRLRTKVASPRSIYCDGFVS